MRRPQGYATFSTPDAPIIERDTATCCHCTAIIFVKPGTGCTTYLVPQLGAADREEPGASCYNCLKPVCLRCHAKGRCVPFERTIERMEARGRMLKSAGLLGLLLCLLPGVASASQFISSSRLTGFTLAVTASGTGSGTVTSSDGSINCTVTSGVASGTCSRGFNATNTITLTAVATGGGSFTSWSGSGCSGTGTCVVGMTTTRAVVATFTSGVAGAAYYLKGGCANNGTGLAPGCAASGGAAGAWNTVDNAYTGWSAVCAPDDTLYIRAQDDGLETMATNNNDDPRWHGGLRAPCSGTSGHVVTIAAYPGEVGRIANGPVGCAWAACDNATITTAEHSYVRIGSTDGLYGTSSRLVVRGAIIAHGTGTQAGVVISGVEISQGWEDTGDGNWAGVRLEDIVAPWVHHGYIHDIIMTAGGTNASSGTGIKVYRSPGAIIENNRVLRACDTEFCGPDGLFESQAGGIDDKDGSVNNRHRYNYITSVPVCLRFQNQGVTATGSQAYGNVCERGTVHANLADHAAIVTEQGDIDDILIHHNTINGWGLGFVLKGAINGSGGLTLRDNIIAAVSGGDPADRNYHDDGSSFALADLNTASDYNAFDSDADYQIDGTSTDLTAWRTASSRDAHSHEEATVCGGFASGTDTNFHISGGTCATGSSTGGEQGAYGVTSCVGHLCT